MAKCDVHNELTHLLQTDDAVMVSVDGTKGAVDSEGAGTRTQILKASLQIFFGQLPVWERWRSFIYSKSLHVVSLSLTWDVFQNIYSYILNTSFYHDFMSCSKVVFAIFVYCNNFHMEEIILYIANEQNLYPRLLTCFNTIILC